MSDFIKSIRTLYPTRKEFQQEIEQIEKDLFKEVCEQQVSASVVLRLHDGATYSPGYACPVCGGEMVIEKIQMQERYMMRLCHRCGTTIKTPYENIEIHTPF